MAYTQEQVNQLAREAAAQAGGSISYQDALAAAAAYGISPEQVMSAMSTGVITGADTKAISNAYLNANPDVKAEYEQFSQQDPTKWNPETYSAYHYLNYGANENRQGSEGIDSYLNSLTKQIMSTSDTSKWSGEGKGSVEANAKDMAGIMLGLGITDLKDFGQITDPATGEKTFGNVKTGQSVGNTYGERQTGDAFGGTYSGEGNTGYRVQFTPDGKPVFYTSAQSSSSLGELMPLIQLGLAATGAGGLLGSALGLSGAAGAAAGGAILGGGTAALTGGDVLKGALLGGAGGYAGSALGDTVAGFGPQTDASFLAADAAQLAGQGLSESAIAQALGSYGSTGAANLAASMAVNGLDVGTMTDQLNNLSTNTGLMSQTGSSADFLAADALQLQGQVGNNFPAIEQNLIASGVDPLIAADVSQQLAFNPGITQSQLATNLSNSFGNNIYDVNMATTYPTSVLPGAGGLLNDLAGTSTSAVTTPPVTTTTPTAGSTITPNKILDAVKLGTVVAGIGGAAAGSGQTGFDIVPVPSDWTTPTYGQPTGQAPGLAPIDFGSRELLRGTQWEKYLNPAQPAVVPAPQTGMNYNQLMNTLQGSQGGSLSLNDIISGIQGQYGQTPSGTVG